MGLINSRGEILWLAMVFASWAVSDFRILLYARTREERQMTHELKPCPFCGGDNITRHSLFHIYEECIDCGAFGPDEHDNRDWNTRTERMQWNHDMEAAPKTGRHLLLWDDILSDVVVGWYRLNHADGGFRSNDSLHVDATHWQHLPSPPE